MDSLKQSQLLQLFDGAVHSHQTQPGIAFPRQPENLEWIEDTLARCHDFDNGLTRSGQAISVILQALKPVRSAFLVYNHEFH